MKTINNIFETSWAQSLAMALLHSLWQSLFIFIIVLILFRLVYRADSVKRYFIATTGLALMLVSAVATFVYLESGPRISQTVGSFDFSRHRFEIPAYTDTTFVDTLTSTIQSNLSIIAACWFMGTILFMFRLVASWWYISVLRNHSIIIDNVWSTRVQTLAKQLNIKRFIVLAESIRISTPAVIGSLRPMILLPVGFLSGLPSEQIESILMHELMHIRRHDYLINMLQSLVESLLFFNPFVWIVSGLMRTEREHCCDDAVISQADATAYAFALAHLEEVRLSKVGLAIALAESKHQLLNRIKRIMEKSAKNYSGREKMIPVLLLVIGLACASWVTIQNTKDANVNRETVSVDTVGKKKVRPVDKPKPMSQVQQNITPNPALAAAPESDEDFPLVIDPIAPFPVIDFVPLMPPTFDFDFAMDSIPPIMWGPQADWSAFSEAFSEKFKQDFGDFYQKNQAGLEKMMKEVEKNVNEKYSKDIENAMKQQEGQMRLRQIAMEAQAEAMVQHQEAMAGMEKQMQQMQRENEHQMRAMEENLKKMEENMKRFEAELHKQLVKDGYLKQDQKITNMRWRDDGDIEINGVKIKDSDKKKYKDLHQKFFKEDTGEFHYVD
jgi:bla regulator protein BlaR1